MKIPFKHYCRLMSMKPVRGQLHVCECGRFWNVGDGDCDLLAEPVA